MRNQGNIYHIFHIIFLDWYQIENKICYKVFKIYVEKDNLKILSKRLKCVIFGN